jgi:hypothetical protein
VRYLALLLLLACGSETPPDPPPPDTPRFTEAEGSSPSLRLAGTLADDLRVDVLADGLGSIFGLAARLAFDPTHLAVEEAELAPGLLSDPAQLIRTDAGAIAFGVTKKGAALGDEMLSSERIATVRFRVLRAGDSELELARAMVRRADGSFVPASFLGAELHTAGGAP